MLDMERLVLELVDGVQGLPVHQQHAIADRLGGMARALAEEIRPAAAIVVIGTWAQDAGGEQRDGRGLVIVDEAMRLVYTLRQGHVAELREVWGTAADEPERVGEVNLWLRERGVERLLRTTGLRDADRIARLISAALGVEHG